MTLKGQLTIHDALAALDEEDDTMTDKCADCGQPLNDGKHGDELDEDVLNALDMLTLVAVEQRRHTLNRLNDEHVTRAALASAATYAKRLPAGTGLVAACVYAYLSYRAVVERATLTESLDEAHALVALLATFPQALTAIRTQSIAAEATAALRDE